MRLHRSKTCSINEAEGDEEVMRNKMFGEVIYHSVFGISYYRGAMNPNPSLPITTFNANYQCCYLVTLTTISSHLVARSKISFINSLV